MEYIDVIADGLHAATVFIAQWQEVFIRSSIWTIAALVIVLVASHRIHVYRKADQDAQGEQ